MNIVTSPFPNAKLLGGLPGGSSFIRLVEGCLYTSIMSTNNSGPKPPATPAEIGAHVIESIRAAIAEKARTENQHAVHVVIRNTSLPYEQGSLFNGCVYQSEDTAAEKAKQETSSWANGKGKLCARVHRDSRDQEQFPHLLQGGDCFYGGGVWRDHIVVAVSGFSENDDHAWAEDIAQRVKEAYRTLRNWYVAGGHEFMGNDVPMPRNVCE